MAPRNKRVEITEDQFKKAIAWLEDGGTKKGACGILGLGNNKTMEARIEEYQTGLEVAARIRREKRRQPCTPQELASIIEAYCLEGESLDNISERFYRSTAYIKHRLELSGAMIRHHGERNPLFPPMLPEECVLLDPDFRVRKEINFTAANLAAFEVEKKKILVEQNVAAIETVDVCSKAGKWKPECAVHIKGETVWLPGYQCLAEVVKEVPSKQGKAYRLYLLDQNRHQYVNIMYWDIGSLRHLEALGVPFSSYATFMNGQECVTLLNEALKAAKKGKK